MSDELSQALASNYVLVDLQLRSWSGKATDRTASDEIIASKGAVRDSGAFVKSLLASAGKELKDVHTAGSAIRTFVYNNTLPWSADTGGVKRGERILSCTHTIQFLTDLNALKKERDSAVITLVSVWDFRVAEAMRNLGNLADPRDYPAASEVAALFAVTVDLKPIPAVTDFSRLNVPAELSNALSARHEQAAHVQVSNAMNDMRDRFVEELARIERQMAKIAAGEKTRLYDTLITNMQVLVDMATHMNLTGNPKLDELVEKIKLRVLTRPVSAYKDNPILAGTLASEVKTLAVEAAMQEVWS